jgi:hypothetical protein
MYGLIGKGRQAFGYLLYLAREEQAMSGGNRSPGFSNRPPGFGNRQPRFLYRQFGFCKGGAGWRVWTNRFDDLKVERKR